MKAAHPCATPPCARIVNNNTTNPSHPRSGQHWCNLSTSSNRRFLSIQLTTASHYIDVSAKRSPRLLVRGHLQASAGEYGNVQPPIRIASIFTSGSLFMKYANTRPQDTTCELRKETEISSCVLTIVEPRAKGAQCRKHLVRLEMIHNNSSL